MSTRCAQTPPTPEEVRFVSDHCDCRSDACGFCSPARAFDDAPPRAREDQHPSELGLEGAEGDAWAGCAPASDCADLRGADGETTSRGRTWASSWPADAYAIGIGVGVRIIAPATPRSPEPPQAPGLAPEPATTPNTAPEPTAPASPGVDVVAEARASLACIAARMPHATPWQAVRAELLAYSYSEGVVTLASALLAGEALLGRATCDVTGVRHPRHVPRGRDRRRFSEAITRARWAITVRTRVEARPS